MECMYLHVYVLECKKTGVILVSCLRCHGNQQKPLNLLLHGDIDISTFHWQIVVKIDMGISKWMYCNVSKAILIFSARCRCRRSDRSPVPIQLRVSKTTFSAVTSLPVSWCHFRPACVNCPVTLEANAKFGDDQTTRLDANPEHIHRQTEALI